MPPTPHTPHTTDSPDTAGFCMSAPVLVMWNLPIIIFYWLPPSITECPMKHLKRTFLFLALATSVVTSAPVAHADIQTECAALRVRIARAEYRREGFVIRGANGLNAIATRLQCDLSTIDTRIARANGLVIRATGTQYEQRAINHLSSLQTERQQITTNSNRRRLRLERRLHKALKRMDARIASFRARSVNLGCRAPRV